MAAACTLSRSASIVVKAPGSGVTPRMCASTASASWDQSSRPSSRVSFGANVGSPSCGVACGRARGEVVDNAGQQGGSGCGEGFQQVPGGLVAPDRTRLHREDVARVEFGHQLEDRGAGLLIAGHDRPLHRCRSAPARQQREVQVDPAEPRARSAAARAPGRRTRRSRRDRVPARSIHLRLALADWRGRRGRPRSRPPPRPASGSAPSCAPAGNPPA